MKDLDMVCFFENIFLFIIDMIVKFYILGVKDIGIFNIGSFCSMWDLGVWEGLQLFIIMGDIIVEWLCDFMNQLCLYQGFVNKDFNIKILLLGVINI